MKLANPLYYPVPIFASAIVLVVGVRIFQVPSGVMLPVVAAIATLGAALRRSQESEALNLDNPELERQLQSVRQQANVLADRATALRNEASNLLTDALQMDLLVAVQYACDRAGELPAKVDQLATRMKGTDSLLSVDDLQRQLREVEAKRQKSAGVAHEHLTKLADSLERNIQLARQGQDAREAQVISLSTVILDAAGVLQNLQNKLRTADLTNTAETSELKLLSDEFRSFQENVELLVSS